ncbi:MAG: hypothetical protein K8R60_15130 [Burkholderiales bacterium]|nr:hypothetical protein [Burkholderiales bacterium]
MDEDFHCEALRSFVLVRLRRAPSERVLEECQICVLEAMQQISAKAVLYDLTKMEQAPASVLLYQRLLNEHLATLGIRRAIVVPNAMIAHLARLAFGGSDFRLFYDDMEGAELFLRDASPFSSADWSVRVIEERRLRERRGSRREPGGRRERDAASL